MGSINMMVDRMFKEGKKSVSRKDQTTNDRFFHNHEAIQDPKLRKQHFEHMTAEAKANDEQVRQTNVRIG